MANVTLTPGTEFGPQFTHSFRMNFSQDKDNAIAALDRDAGSLMERYRSNKHTENADFDPGWGRRGHWSGYYTEKRK